MPIRHREIYFALLISTLIALAGCGTFSAPANPSEAIGQGYAAITTVAHDVSAARISGLISDSQASDAKSKLQAAKSNLDSAVAIYTAGGAAPTDALAQTQLVLNAIIALLEANGAKPKGA